MSTLSEYPGALQPTIKSDTDVMQDKLYKNCYHAHLVDDWWKKLAEYVLSETHAAYCEGYDRGLEDGQP